MEQLPLILAPAPPPTLDNFVPGRNQTVVDALRRFLADPASDRSIYLWGPTGAGRSHLLSALAEAARAEAIAVYTLNEMPPPSARRLLLLDDVDQLDVDGQQAAFEQINHALLLGARVLASGRAPARSLELRDDLRSRLAQCLNLPLEPLNEADKRAALSSRAQGAGVQLAASLLDYLLSHSPRDMGRLMATIEALDRRSLVDQRAVTPPLLRPVMQALDEQRTASTPTPHGEPE